jgi:hypothetical protein
VWDISCLIFVRSKKNYYTVDSRGNNQVSDCNFSNVCIYSVFIIFIYYMDCVVLVWVKVKVLTTDTARDRFRQF